MNTCADFVESQKLNSTSEQLHSSYALILLEL